jgi:TetR/AcrR family transcriptional regulator
LWTIFRQRFLTALNDPTWVRFVTWEALDYPRSRRIARQDRREVALRNQRNAIIAKQFHGLLPKTVKAELLQLALYALATYPLAYAPITKMVTGKLPSDPKFQQEWMAFLDQLGALLAAADADG